MEQNEAAANNAVFEDLELNAEDDGANAIHVFCIVSEERSLRFLEATRLNDAALKFTVSSHQKPLDHKHASQATLFVVECRIVEALQDLQVIRSIRQKRPMVGIIALSANPDSDFVLELFKTGVNDCVLLKEAPTILNAKIKSLHKITESARLIEVQNENLIASMKAMREAHNERMAAQEQLVESAKLASLGEMAGGIAHEINTPLGIVLGSASMLKDMLNEQPIQIEEMRKICDEIDRMAERINAIIRGLKSYSRKGELDPMEEVEVATIVKDTLALCDEVIERQGIKLIINAYDSKLRLTCRPTQISQVLLNLLSNARYAVAKLKDKWIKLDIKNIKDMLEVSVTDSGPGIPVELQEKIFQSFFTTKEKGVGTGLGLSISQKLIVGHNGRLFLDTKSPNTRFVFQLPLQSKN